MNKNKTTVDHLIAVDAAQKAILGKGTLKHFGIENANDPKSLVPACMAWPVITGSSRYKIHIFKTVFKLAN